MIRWCLKSRKLLHDLRKKAVDALGHCEENENQAVKTIASYMRADYQQLCDHWHSQFPEERFGNLGRHIGFAMKNDFNDIIKYDIPMIEERLDAVLEDFQKTLPDFNVQPYVAEERIEELESIRSGSFDTAKLIRLLCELNIAHQNNLYLTTGILVRAIIDHVPPVFGFLSFAEVANNCKGTKSFKSAMKRLNDSLRNLADSYLHVQIRKIESLPTFNQVDFRAELDALLSEVSRVLQGA